MTAPPIVWIDERIARGLAQDKDRELAERGVDQIRYISQERVNALVDAARGGEEFIVQLSGEGLMYGLSNLGRVWAFMSEDSDTAPAWHLIAERELAP